MSKIGHEFAPKMCKKPCRHFFFLLPKTELMKRKKRNSGHLCQRLLKARDGPSRTEEATQIPFRERERLIFPRMGGKVSTWSVYLCSAVLLLAKQTLTGARQNREKKHPETLQDSVKMSLKVVLENRGKYQDRQISKNIDWQELVNPQSELGHADTDKQGTRWPPEETDRARNTQRIQNSSIPSNETRIRSPKMAELMVPVVCPARRRRSPYSPAASRRR